MYKNYILSLPGFDKCVCVYSTINGQDGRSVRTNRDLSEYRNETPGFMEREEFLGQPKNIVP
jgi:hypothetical protein